MEEFQRKYKVNKYDRKIQDAFKLQNEIILFKPSCQIAFYDHCVGGYDTLTPTKRLMRML